jgi:hypothetical protein
VAPDVTRLVTFLANGFVLLQVRDGTEDGHQGGSRVKEASLNDGNKRGTQLNE